MENDKKANEKSKVENGKDTNVVEGSKPTDVKVVIESASEDKESKDAKYALICAICGQKEVQNIIPPEILKQLRSYVKQGAFYVEATVEVAIEEQ